MKERTLKLYVWEDVLCDWTCGIMFALAYDVRQARKLIREKRSGFSSKGLDLAPQVIKAPKAFAISGGS